MPTVEGYEFIFVATNGRHSVFIIAEPDEANARAHFAAKYGKAQIRSWRPLNAEAVRARDLGSGGSKEIP